MRQRAALLVVVLTLSASMAAQRGPQAAKDAAPVDLTGYDSPLVVVIPFEPVTVAKAA